MVEFRTGTRETERERIKRIKKAIREVSYGVHTPQSGDDMDLVHRRLLSHNWVIVDRFKYSGSSQINTYRHPLYGELSVDYNTGTGLVKQATRRILE